VSLRAAVLCAVALLAAGCGDDDEPAAPESPVELVEEAPEQAPDEVARDQPREPRVLGLSDRGTPVLTVKHNRRVDLYDRPGGKVLDSVGDETEFGSHSSFAVLEERDGWAAVPTPLYENGTLVWMKLDPRKLDAGWIALEVRVDLSEFRADLLRRGKVIHSFPVSIGMPEAPTPTGHFAVTDTFRGGLNPAYGCCAVALTARQTRLPSGWFGGDRIAIHGTTGPLGAAISHGCVRAADADVSELVNRLPPGTPVTIRQ
jgi:hypothetical protein